MNENQQRDLAVITPDDLTLANDNSLNADQLKLLLKKTPAQYVHSRPAKGGGEWDYVTGGYMKKVLNLMFGWDWDFEIISDRIVEGEAVVLGKLTCRSNGKQIVKMQFGNKDVVFKKGTQTPLSIGNDLKAAATDALKKCAAEIGIAADIYNKLDFKEVIVQQEVAHTGIVEIPEILLAVIEEKATPEELVALYNANQEYHANPQFMKIIMARAQKLRAGKEAQNG